jgi:hypothetical protein
VFFDPLFDWLGLCLSEHLHCGTSGWCAAHSICWVEVAGGLFKYCTCGRRPALLSFRFVSPWVRATCCCVWASGQMSQCLCVAVLEYHDRSLQMSAQCGQILGPWEIMGSRLPATV